MLQWDKLCSCRRSLLTQVMKVSALASAAVLCASAAHSQVSLRDADGGPQYYDQFANALPSDPNFFPIGVWFESVVSQGDIDLDKEAGLNLYVVLTGNSNLSLVRSNGMYAILQQSEWRNNATAQSNPAVVGWELSDEIDMTQGPGAGYTTLNNILASLPKDGRKRYNNYGKGVMFWQSDADAQRFVNEFQSPTSNDIYGFTDPHVSGASEGGKLLNGGQPLTTAQTRRAANYGYTVDRMRKLDAMDGKHKPIWNFVEVCWPFTESATQGGRAIQPAEVYAAVWHSIIAGARGIIYFNHSFGGPHQSQHCLRDPYYANVRDVVKRTNRQIQRLAPVLNAPFADNFVKPSSSVRAMAKWYKKQYYVFAGSKENKPSIATFQLAGITSGTATLFGANGRTIRIRNGQFSDKFADGNAIHIYRIDKD